MKKIVFKCDGIYTIILQRIGGQMRKKWKTLSASQAQFIEYVNKNLDNSNRIIFFKHIGHLGLDYAILSRFKKSEILSFEQLKTKTGKNAFFRLVNSKRWIVRTYTKQEQTCMIKTDLLLSYFTSSLSGFRQFAGRSGDQGSRSSRKPLSVSSRCFGISASRYSK